MHYDKRVHIRRAQSSVRAFTLIELLVVIAIIAILAAILFPVFAQAKDAARQAQCVIQMKQIGLGLVMYSNDNDSFWAPVANASTTGPGYEPQKPWIGYDNRNGGGYGQFFGDMTRPATHPLAPGLIDPYLKSDAIKKCPNAPNGFQMALAYNYWHNCAPQAYCDAYSPYWDRNPNARLQEYGPGAKLMDNRLGFVTAQGVNDSEIEEPSNTIALWEHGAWAPVCTYLMIFDWFDHPPADTELEAHFKFLHHQGSVLVWCDGHTRRVVYGALKRPMFSVRKDIYR